VEDVIFPTTISSESEQARPAIDSQNQPVPHQLLMQTQLLLQVQLRGPIMNILQLLLHKLPKRYRTDNVTFVLWYCTHSLDLVLFFSGEECSVLHRISNVLYYDVMYACTICMFVALRMSHD